MTDENPFDDSDVPTDPLDDLDRATQQLTVRTEERRYGKKDHIELQGDHGERVRELLEENGYTVSR